jgi:glutaredoxin-related protein
MELLLFSAEYCRPCQTLKALLAKNNISYDIKAIPTVIVADAASQEVLRIVGLKPLAEYVAAAKLVAEAP